MNRPAGRNVRLGLRANWEQFTLLVVVNAFVGAMVGLERSVLPLLAEEDFGLASRTAILSFLVSFGLVKAGTNYFAGRLSDRIGRKPVLLLGWLAALPVPVMIIFAPSWGWVVAANVLLGVNQGLAWSTTVIKKIDLVGPERRGLAMGLNEAAGYVAVSLAALAAGYLAASYGVRPAPFLPGVGFAVLGLLLTLFFVRETQDHARLEASQTTTPDDSPGGGRVFVRTSFTDRNLSSVSQAGLVNNLNDGMAWGLLPLFFAASGLPIERIGVLAAVYPGVWGLGQLATGWMSDHLGRKWMIVCGMWLQAAGILLISLTGTFALWLAGSILMGLGTALAYPTLLAAVGDAAHPAWRASAVGVYRLWRDLGYAAGALLAGVLADLFGFAPAIAAIGALTAASGLVVAARMREKRRPA
ncbi:MAG TPA: MFS transporter [Rubrobacteraceae bacterium]|nr:MFS transporter [Rubrobacteraceae bacterium]